MSHENDNSFYFASEEKPDIPVRHQRNKRFSLLLNVLCLGFMAGGALFWFFPALFPSGEKGRQIAQTRGTASQLAAEKEFAKSEPRGVPLEPFFVLVRFKSSAGFRLTKVEVILYITPPTALKELRSSLHKIKNHLIFILSAKDVSVFGEDKKLRLLKEEIIRQLNLFLVSGQIMEIRLRETSDWSQ